jgi:uncharacterized membrane protein
MAVNKWGVYTNPFEEAEKALWKQADWYRAPRKFRDYSDVFKTRVTGKKQVEAKPRRDYNLLSAFLMRLLVVFIVFLAVDTFVASILTGIPALILARYAVKSRHISEGWRATTYFSFVITGFALLVSLPTLFHSIALHLH